MILKSLLAHPLTRNIDIDDPLCTELRSRIVREKRFLRNLYTDWYHSIHNYIPPGEAPVIELGSGGGFMKDIIPQVITTDILNSHNMDIVMDGTRLPFSDDSLRAVVMTFVFHHIPDPSQFLDEATRCIQQGGRIIMLEPWVTPWSSFVYSRLHHESFWPHRGSWQFISDGPLSGANSALPWIVFERDRSLFNKKYPFWSISIIKLTDIFCYLLSGGISMRSFMPGFMYKLCHGVENLLEPWRDKLSLLALIVLEKRHAEKNP